jgi:hypothetical protein
LLTGDLRFHHLPGVSREFAHLDASAFRREQKRLRHNGHSVGNAALKDRQATLK